MSYREVAEKLTEDEKKIKKLRKKYGRYWYLKKIKENKCTLNKIIFN